MARAWARMEKRLTEFFSTMKPSMFPCCEVTTEPKCGKACDGQGSSGRRRPHHPGNRGRACSVPDAGTVVAANREIERRSACLFDSEFPQQAFGWSALESWRAENIYISRLPKPELYDLSADPGASRNLAQSSKATLDTMAGQLEAFDRRFSGRELPPV